MAIIRKIAPKKKTNPILAKMEEAAKEMCLKAHGKSKEISLRDAKSLINHDLQVVPRF